MSLHHLSKTGNRPDILVLQWLQRAMAYLRSCQISVVELLQKDFYGPEAMNYFRKTFHHRCLTEQSLKYILSLHALSGETRNEYQWYLSYPPNMYLFKVNNTNTRKRCEICSKLTIKTPGRRHWSRSGVFIVNFKYVSHLFLGVLWLTLNK